LKKGTRHQYYVTKRGDLAVREIIDQIPKAALPKIEEIKITKGKARTPHPEKPHPGETI
jgi:hypothetical protein